VQQQQNSRSNYSGGTPENLEFNQVKAIMPTIKVTGTKARARIKRHPNLTQ
jgi:hypothetical protein